MRITSFFVRLARAANQSQEVNEVLLRELDISKVDLDELLDYRGKKVAPRSNNYEDDGTWIWVSLVSECRLVIAHIIGERNQNTANMIIAETAKRLASVPLYVTDGLKFYIQALLEQYGKWIRFESSGLREDQGVLG